MTTKANDHTNFTVFIRLPFPRGPFVDPPPMVWNASKDQALWDILSRPSKGDIDCMIPFLLQQAAWLYDRQLSQVRAQMRKVGTTQSHTPSPLPGSVSGSAALGGQPQRETPDTFLSRKIPPSEPLVGLYLTLIPAPEIRGASLTSTTTTNQARGNRDSTRTATPTVTDREPRWDSFGGRPSATTREQPPVTSLPRSPTLDGEISSSLSEESESDNEVPGRHAPLFKRFGKFSIQRSGLRDDEDDEDDTPAFLPLPREHDHAYQERPAQELSATLRLDAELAAGRRRPDQRPGPRMPVTSESSGSSMTSSGPVSLPSSNRRVSQAPPMVMSPQRALGARQTSRKSTASGREASDGTPSMGSSFSDLDDASVTQSALEEALLSNMQHGGMASRMSTISQALRSRYLQ
ncbi:hypothetical protein N7535_007481 [Penicillium sp. DV-2018c]|nr:hypothetical protein N7535_007481 [Penicillium sp. DV-2018c]